MQSHQVVSSDEWLNARQAFLAKEKAFTRMRDELSRERRALPWVKVDTPYTFDAPGGKETFADLFAGKSQLIVYHFMFDPDWQDGCKSCSFWADNYNAIVTHLNQRDVSMVTISKAPLAKLEAFKRRMGWTFKWVSSFSNSFNRDYGVSYTSDERERGEIRYNYRTRKYFSSEAPGISVFHGDDKANIFHTYSCYERGLDMLNGAYHYLDLVPKGRDEAALSYPMAWVRLHDRY
ncbi:MAG: DUF899 domain-containing protein [Burkholderiales bacterium]